MKTSMSMGGAAIAAIAAVAVVVPAASAAQAAPAGPAHTTVTAQTVAAWKLGFPVLREGKNADYSPVTVRSLQHLLNARGAHLVVDGIFGPRTRAAVIAFQKAHKLVVDGVVGNRTWRALIITVRYGSRGPAVRAVQEEANFRNLRNGHSLDVDGIFGLRTRAWVIGFQKAMRTMVPGFQVDGIVGPQTWAALVSEALAM